MSKNKARKFYQKRQAEKLAKKRARKSYNIAAPAGHRKMWNYSLQQFEFVPLDELIPTNVLNPQNLKIASTLKTSSKSAARIGRQNFIEQYKNEKLQNTHYPLS